MNEFSVKWDEIYEMGHSAGRFRVFPDHPLNFFIGFTLNGKREVIVEAIADNLNAPELPAFRNIDLSVNNIANGLNFVMILNDKGLSQSFGVMCYDLVQRSKHGKTAASALQIFITALGQWSELFKKKPIEGLTRSETIGLFGELLVIKRLISDNAVDCNLVVMGWSGPNGDARDIGFNESRIEVKTQLSTKVISLKISSLDQLDDNGDKVHVVLNRISPSEHGGSLNDLVDSLRYLLKFNFQACSEFETKLELASYDQNSAYADEKFGLDDTFVYIVNESFPRLTPQNVPDGIGSASYEIRGLALDHHKISWGELIGAING